MSSVGIFTSHFVQLCQGLLSLLDSDTLLCCSVRNIFDLRCDLPDRLCDFIEGADRLVGDDFTFTDPLTNQLKGRADLALAVCKE